MKAYNFQTEAKANGFCPVSEEIILLVWQDVKIAQSTLAKSPLVGKKLVWNKGDYMINDERLRQPNLQFKGGC